MKDLCRDALERLNLDRVEILFIHSPTSHFEVAMAESYPALAEMRSSGIVKAIGVGMTDSRKLLRSAQEGDFDCFLLAGRYALLDQSALAEFLRIISILWGAHVRSNRFSGVLDG